jgi:hypothetical protein
MQVQHTTRLNGVSRIRTETDWRGELLVRACVCVDGPDCTYEWLYGSNNTACSNNSIQFNSIEVLDCTNKAYYRQALKEAPLTKSGRIIHNKTTVARAQHNPRLCCRWPYCLHSTVFNSLRKIKILFRQKLRAGWSRGMFTTIRCRIFCLPVCYPKI